MLARRHTGVALGGLLAFGLLYVLATVRSVSLPHDDAAMLLRYAENLAGGHGFVWNLGEAPVDGATDFLFLVATAGVSKLGLSVSDAALALGVAAHVATVGVVFLGVLRVGAPLWMALVSGAYLALGPGAAYAESHFGTPLLALLAAVNFYFAQAVRRDPDRSRSLAFGLSGLLLGLARPDGALLAGLVLLGLCGAEYASQRSLSRAWRAVRRPVAAWVGAYLLGGGAYFVWHWVHFDHPLPNPYYVKSSGVELDNLVNSVSWTLALCGPWVVLLLLGLRSRRTAPAALLGLVPVIAFALVWAPIESSTNYLGRFQYAALPIALMSWPAALAGLASEPRLRPIVARARSVPRPLGIALVALVALLVAGAQYAAFDRPVKRRAGVYDVARILRDYDGRRYVLATTEAGILPLHSRWRAVDTFGLNDAWIAHHGVSEDYLRRRDPAVILVHQEVSSGCRQGGAPPGWGAMVETVKAFAERGGYQLVAAYGHRPQDTHLYYVRRDLPDAAAITRRIRRVRYARERGDRRPAIDFAGRGCN